MGRNSDRESFLPPLWVVSSALLLLGAWLVVQLKEILVLLVLGYCVAYVVNPFLARLERRKIPRGIGFVIIFLVVFLAIALLGAIALPTLAREFNRLLVNLPASASVLKDQLDPLVNRLESVIPAAANLRGIFDSPLTLLQNIKPEAVQGLLGGLFKALLGGYSLTLTLINLLLVPLIAFYLAVDFEILHRRALELFPARQRQQVREMALEMNQYVSGFIRGQTVVAAILFVLFAIGLGLLGVELWFVLAVITGIGSVIPYFGYASGILLSSVMALLTFGTFSGLAKVWLLFGLIAMIEGNFITPRVVGEKVGLSPLSVILALLAGGKLFGLLGVLLAVPGAAIFKVCMNRLHNWLLSKA